MKRCSTCNRTYTDPALSFCIDDGTPLTTVEPQDEETVVRSRDNEDQGWNARAYQPPGSYVPPGGEVKRRRAWPWILGIGGAFLLGIVAISIAVAILAPKLLRSGRNERASSNINRVEKSSTPEESNSNTNSTQPIDTPPPTDREQVLAQLTALENEWTVANLNADKKKLERILADDYAGQAPEEGGGLQSKADYIRSLERDTQVDKWEFSDLHLTLAGDRATLSGTITYVVQGRDVVFDFTDKFVWRDGRWQATGAQIKQRQGSGADL
jgi:Domain of unknown function (DUF4440)